MITYVSFNLIHDPCIALGHINVLKKIRDLNPRNKVKKQKRECVLEAFDNNDELPKIIKDLIGSSLAGLEKGNRPIRTLESSGGVYFMPNVSGDGFVGVFKPTDEEPYALNNPYDDLKTVKERQVMKKGMHVGEGAMKEVVAYILDHPLKNLTIIPPSLSKQQSGFAGVPPTTMIRCLHDGFNHPTGFENSPKCIKIGSLQKYVSFHSSCWELKCSLFPISEVHKITVLDIRLANTDRHDGNILACNLNSQNHDFLLVPIDHGYCLPETVSDYLFI